MSLEIKELNSKKELKKFVNFPYELYKNNKFWVPPIKIDELNSLLPEKNPAFSFCKCKFWLVLKNNQVLGRIGAIINEEYNKKTGVNIGRFTRFECINDIEVAALLLNTAEDYLRKQGMEEINGPLGFTNLDHQGMLVEGFDYLPSVASEYHFPYYKNLLEQLGYKKKIDWIELRITVKEIPQKAKKVAELIKKRNNLEVLSFTKTKNLKPLSREIFQLYNKAFSELFGVVHLNESLINFYVKKYLTLLNPRFIKIVRDSNKKIIGFTIALPSLSKAFQKSNGNLFPFGIFYIQNALKNNDTADLLLGGVDPEWQGKGIPALLITEIQQTMLEYGIKYVETTGIFETNQKAIQIWKNFEHIQHKRKRCFMKKL